MMVWVATKILVATHLSIKRCLQKKENSVRVLGMLLTPKWTGNYLHPQ